MPNTAGTKPRSLVYDINGSRQEFLLEEVCTIGRHYENDVVLEGRGVSRFHAKIHCGADQARLVDCDSRHGTKVNGEPIKYHVLQHGDCIQIQKFELYYNETGTDLDLLRQNEVKFTSTHTGTKDVRIKASEESLFRAETLQELQRANEQLRKVQSVGADMVEATDSASLMKRIQEILCDIFMPDQAAILVVNESTGNLIPATTYPAHSGKEITISHTITDEVRSNQVALLSTDVQHDDRFNEAMSIINIGIGSTMCAPLIVKGRFLGVIYLISFNKNDGFSEGGLELLMGIANQAAIAIENNRLQEQIAEELVLRNQLERYVSGPLLEAIIRGDVNMEPGGIKREVTVMFSDIKGFTSISESHSPEEVVEMLNEYFDLMVDSVFEFDGTLDKYAGDGIMAVWGSLIHVDNHADAAVNSATLMLRHISDLNQRRKSLGRPEFHVRIGICTGVAVCGNIGSRRRLEYTVIGDTVNTAARLENQAPYDSLLLSETTYLALSNPTSVNASRFGEILLKGKERPTPTYLIRL